MNYLPDDAFRDKNKRQGPTMTRIVIWLVVGGFGAYLLISGIIAIVGGGG